MTLGWVVWVLGEQSGWEQGFLDGADLRAEEDEETRRLERQRAKDILKRLERVGERITDGRDGSV